MLTEYEHLDLTPPSIPPRSRLFPLEPVGVGTPYVESLTGYVSRLAAAHCVKPERLLISEVAPLASGKYLSTINSAAFANTASHLSDTLNGPNRISAECVSVMERLTGRQDLAFLTMHRLAGVLSNHKLVRHERAWCPSCYEEQAAAGLEVYDQLLWSFSDVRVCPRHSRPLCYECPRCGSRFSWLGPNARVAHCAKCEEWLGHPPGEPPGGDGCPPAEDVRAEATVSEAVGALLAAVAGITPDASGRIFSDNLSAYLEGVAAGQVNRLAGLVGMSGVVLGCWVRGVRRPQLRSILHFCAAVGTTPADILFREAAIGPAVIESLNGRRPRDSDCRGTSLGRGAGGRESRRALRPGPKKIDYAAVGRHMTEALEEYPPPTVKDLARRLGVSDRLLYARFRELVLLVSARVKQYMRRTVGARMLIVLEGALDEYPPPTMSEVARRIAPSPAGNRNSSVWKYHPEMCRAISARHAAYREERGAAKMKILEAEMRRAVADLCRRGIYPSEQKVLSVLENSPGMRRADFAEVLRQVREEFGLRVTSTRSDVCPVMSIYRRLSASPSCHPA